MSYASEVSPEMADGNSEPMNGNDAKIQISSNGNGTERLVRFSVNDEDKEHSDDTDEHITTFNLKSWRLIKFLSFFRNLNFFFCLFNFKSFMLGICGQ